ncbi:hypothetical protein KHC28_25850 [Ancylobacter sonchi]|uniref:hypothetical protein n=1 Tax=Ancylobacter sonchi TaxID=1937790 RepID=UPI001BD55FAD|nr:hypothetical protein [Ancylobacter sonchi]MBS7537077.1 hypothetical protein [Ancylobacter sonchi]
MSTNDEAIIEACDELAPSISKELIVDRRPEEYGTSQTSTDDLIDYALRILPDDSILWTHVTSPFVIGSRYDEMIVRFQAGLNEGYDSLMSAGVVRTFLWNDRGPLNYDRSVEKWPRTQTLPPVYEIDSAAFIANFSTMIAHADRIGSHPVLFPLTSIEHLDIDWEEDFHRADEIWRRMESSSGHE